MKTSIRRNNVVLSVMVLFIFILLSACHKDSDSNHSKAISEDANLANISLSSGTLSPQFNENTTSYSAQVPYSTSWIRVTVATSDSDSTITVNGTAVLSGGASPAINLVEGSNTITIVVTAQDGKTTRAYTVVVTRLEQEETPSVSTDANLSKITLSEGTLSPTFDSSITSYTALVFSDSISITPKANNSNSTITVNGTAVNSGFAESINLILGANTITIVVTAQDGKATITYKVVVTRQVKSNNADLSGIRLSTGSITPAFVSSLTSYTAQVALNITSIKVTPTAANAYATIAVDGHAVSSGSASQSIALLAGANTITIVVTSQDKSATKTYTVRAEKNNGFLWMSGDDTDTINQYGIYDSSDPSEIRPGARYKGMSWTGDNDHFWLFGGAGYDGTGNKGYLNDLWMFDGENWNWLWGSDTIDQPVYGEYDDTDLEYGPGGRDGGVSWIDTNGNLWLFGGEGYGSAGEGFLNDLWMYNDSWHCVSGTGAVNRYGQYSGTTLLPGARHSSVSWIDGDELWLFGGWGYDGTGNLGYLNDLWKFDGTWHFVSGSNTVNQGGVYGTKGTPAASNRPGGRYCSVSWTDSDGNFWLFGGVGRDSAVNEGYLNDLWKFNGTSWTWVSGDSTRNQYGVYSGAVAANKPGSRWGSVGWIDSSGVLWLFGGSGYASSGAGGYLNDLWKFEDTHWIWVAGDSTINNTGVYGSSTSPNKPGSRDSSISWIDSSEGLWFFGGFGYDGAGHVGFLNDLWKYK